MIKEKIPFSFKKFKSNSTSSIFIFLIAQAIFSLPANAEYRVYQYYVRQKNPLFPTAKAYLITSSLDPVSYKSYHGGDDSLVVDLLRTWICPGHTGNNLDYCESPYAKLGKMPASTSADNKPVPTGDTKDL